MSKFKKTIIGLTIFIVMGIGIYLGYYQEDEGLNNIGFFITWINSIFLFLALWGEKNGEKNKNIIMKIFVNVVFVSYIAALVYKAEYFHATIWLIFYLYQRYEPAKSKLDENIKKTN